MMTLAPDASKSQSIFKNRTVCYMDIMGFGERVSKTSSEDASGLDAIASILFSVNDAVGKYDHSNLTFQSFSDSIFIATSDDHVENIKNLLVCCADIFKLLLLKGFVVRGGISSGRCLVSPTIVLGEPIVRAVKLESHVAEYPRIVIGSRTISILRKDPDLSLFGNMITRQKDGPYWIDPFFSTLTEPLLALDKEWKASKSKKSKVESEEALREREALLQQVSIISKYLTSQLAELQEDRRTFSFFYWLYEAYHDRLSSVKQVIGDEVELPTFSP